jgi:hypothetical protein
VLVEAPTILDKLAQLHPTLIVKGLGTQNATTKLQKRAQAKWITQNVVRLLLTLDSPLKRYYKNAFSCCSVIRVINGKAETQYCNTRICNVCNRIRTAKAINNYVPQFEGFTNYAITLTDQNCKGSELKHTIRRYKLDLKIIRRRLQRLGLVVDGIVKVEITYNRTTGLYHPHLHLIVRCKSAQEGLFLAECIVNEWLSLRGTANVKAQHYTITDEGSFKELFKYTTKSGTKEENYIAVHPESLDVIMQAQYNTRSFQPFGKIRVASEEVNEIVEAQEPINAMPGKYLWVTDDWYNLHTGEALSYYLTNPKFRVVRVLNKGSSELSSLVG